MDFLTRDFIAAANRLRDELEAIKAALLTLHQDFQNQTRATRDAQEAANANKVPDYIISGLPHGVEVRKSAQDKRDEKKDQSQLLRVQRLTIFIVALYTGFAALQWIEMTRATNAAESAVSEAQKNRTQADSAFKETVKQFRLDQRAWIGVDNITGFPKVGDYFNIDVGIKNTGKTPVKKLNIFTTYHGAKKGEKVSFTPVLTKDVLEPSNAMLPPNSIYHANPPQPPDKVAQADFDLLKTGEAKIYVFGNATYEDVFSCHHWMHFCYYLTPDAKNWAVCSQHNDTGDIETKDCTE